MIKTNIISRQPDETPLRAKDRNDKASLNQVIGERAINEIEDLLLDVTNRGGIDYLTANHFIYSHEKIRTLGQAREYLKAMIERLEKIN